MVLLCACSRGETTARPDGSTAGAPTGSTLAAGTLVDAAITDAISSRQAHAGDAFTADVVEDVTNGGGVVIPAGSTVHGTITEVKAASSAGSTGTLTLAISSVTVRGETYDVSASIDSLATTTKGRPVSGGDVARVAGGAAAGAILGRVIGGNATGTVVGGVIGGVAGVAVSAAIKDVDIVLPAGTHLLLTLRQPLTVMAN
jgi:hypothetical protein